MEVFALREWLNKFCHSQRSGRDINYCRTGTARGHNASWLFWPTRCHKQGNLNADNEAMFRCMKHYNHYVRTGEFVSVALLTPYVSLFIDQLSAHKFDKLISIMCPNVVIAVVSYYVLVRLKSMWLLMFRCFLEARSRCHNANASSVKSINLLYEFIVINQITQEQISFIVFRQSATKIRLGNWMVPYLLS